MTIALRCFQLRVRDSLFDQRCQIGRSSLRGRSDRVESSQRQKSADHVIQAPAVTLNSVEQFVLAEALAGYA
jgi:hypothetical protein